MIVNSFDTNLDFFKTNPQLKIISEFKELKSNELWAIALIYDPDSKFFNLPLVEKQSIISKEVLKNEKYDWKSVEKQINIYTRLSTTSAQRQLIEWNRIMDEKSEFLKTITYDPTTYEMIESMLKSNTKLYEELERIQDSIAKQNNQTAIKGSGMESATEQKIFEN